MKFRADVEPPEPMRGLEVPEEVVVGLAGGKRPRVIVTINGHSWRTRVAVLARQVPDRLEQRQPQGSRR
jgi:hypothetical protein